MRVWRNECLRVIGDRLINDTDKELLNVGLFSFTVKFLNFLTQEIITVIILKSKIVFNITNHVIKRLMCISFSFVILQV